MRKVKYSKWSKEKLVDEICRLEDCKKYGIVWEEEQERVVEQCKSQLPILEEIEGKAISKAEELPANILIEGDNYEALSILNYTHAGRVDLIYIDPPYNTGNKDFKYNDSFVNTEDTYRHSKWLSFMSKRLRLGWNLLKNSGIIFISIDDNEQAHLKMLCDEIFGEEKFVTTIHVQMSTVQGQKVKSAKSGNIVKNAEFILVYSKNGKKDIGKNVLYDPIEYDSHYSLYLENTKEGVFKEIPLTAVLCRDTKLFSKLKLLNLAEEKNGTRSMSNKSIAEAYAKLDEVKEFIHKNAAAIVRVHDFVELEDQTLIKKLKKGLVAEYKSGKRSYLVGLDSKGEFKQRIPLIEKIHKADDFYNTFGVTTIRGDWWPGFYLDMGNISKEGGVDFKNGKKPVRLIKQLIHFTQNQPAIVLDFFAGSGTTAQAVLELSKEQSLQHQFILCTNNENGIIQETTYPRIKNVIEGYASLEGVAANLRYFKTSFVKTSEVSDDTRRELVKRSTEMICMKEGAFLKVIDNKKFKIYRDKEHVAGILFDLDAITEFKKKIVAIGLRASLYVFSLTNDAFESDFDDLVVTHTLCPIPESILEVYRRLFV